ncbi:guanylate kinase [Candidatus Nesciobacter abundans]|uniref:Guanylate kinase-like domain-containing protein n=1 Tax=Candidatus Nesciobacter abundans TaxID=2601668 RepID=A0A5C0UHR2_9PROT|nr:hypothetical protein [Candidatus Nesciobacter abundans]QEK39250.1 hypothetical protein FZC36_02345 [Candidatus Nesciobacter abundans]
MSNLVIVLVGPSGSGKTSLSCMLVDFGFYKPITCTTRSKRDSEKHGVDYFFLSEYEFLQRKELGKLADWDNIFGCWYGIEKSQVEDINKPIILAASYKGVENLKESTNKKVISVFLNPPSKNEIECRINDRDGSVCKDNLKKRMTSFDSEMENMSKCDYVVSTDQAIEKSLEDILCIHSKFGLI